MFLSGTGFRGARGVHKRNRRRRRIATSPICRDTAEGMAPCAVVYARESSRPLLARERPPPAEGIGVVSCSLNPHSALNELLTDLSSSIKPR